MKKYRLKITRDDFDELKRLVMIDKPKEAGAFALAGIAELGNQVDILVRRPIEIPNQLVPVQNEYHLEVSPQAINGLIALCESNGLGAVIAHSHPEGGLSYSPSDDYGENRIANSLRNFIPTKTPVASLLFTQNDVTGRVWLPGRSKPILLDEIVVIGHYLQRIEIMKAHSEKLLEVGLYDRQVRAFGKDGQKAMSNAKVGIIGVGGTGSPIAEQLVRLGVTDIVLIDPDTFSSTNITRVYGTFFSSTRRFNFLSKYKVNLVASHLKKINPRVQIRAIKQSVVLNTVAPLLSDRDILFLCTDEHWGRSIVNQLSYQYLIPTINVGVKISSQNGTITNAVGVLDILRPDIACLWCKQFLRSERISAESMPNSNRQSLLEEGYVEDLDTKEPSVISFTSSVASSATSIFLHMFTNFMGESGNISRISFDFLTGLSRRGITQIDNNCICLKAKGKGDFIPLPLIAQSDFVKISRN